MMRDRSRKRSSVWAMAVFFIWCSLLFFSFYFHLAQLWFTAQGFHPRLVSKRNIPATEVKSTDYSVTPAVSIRETVIFSDEAVVFLKYLPSTALFTKDEISCSFSAPNSSELQPEVFPVASVYYDNENHRQIVRCPLPPRGSILSLVVKHNGNLTPGPAYRWDSLAYEAMIDRDNSTLVFVKGLNLRPGRAADSSKFKCLYSSWDFRQPKYVLSANPISVAQEIVRCRTPLSLLNSNSQVRVSVRVVGRKTLNSIARLKPGPVSDHRRPKLHSMCVCTMVRNQAQFLREWIIYHSSIGVQRWFIYDNNSNDEIAAVVDSLLHARYNVSLHLWPWIKTQEAGFAHCAIRARDSCEWVGFIDVDEFLHLPSGLSLDDVVGNQSLPAEVAEIRVSCHSFGPSGLTKVLKKGVMTSYTCRLAAPERHKSIVKPEALNSSLINVVHHFHLKRGFRHVDINRTTVVINHYKYQVWEVFKEKFYRRVATYVSDWKQERNVGSKDRVPGLGTKAVEPSDWSSRFCEVNDTGLRDRVVETFGDPGLGLLPWEEMMDGRSSI